MNLQASLFGGAAPGRAELTPEHVAAILRQGERTERQIAALTGRTVDEVREVLVSLQAAGLAVTDPTDGVWFRPWTSPEASCERCRGDEQTVLCSCGYRRVS